MSFALAAFLLLQAGSGTPVIDNEFVRVFKNSAPCAAPGPLCGERVIVALGAIQAGGQKMERGAVKVFKTGEKYSAPTGGDFDLNALEVGDQTVVLRECHRGTEA